MTKLSGDLQDGMLAHYLSQAGASDANVEKRLDREPFDFREYWEKWVKQRIADASRVQKVQTK